MAKKQNTVGNNISGNELSIADIRLLEADTQILNSLSLLRCRQAGITIMAAFKISVKLLKVSHEFR